MDTKAYTFTPSKLEAQLDVVKSVILAELVKDDLISAADAHTWSETHCVLLRKRNKFRTMFNKLFQTDVSETGGNSLKVLIASINPEDPAGEEDEEILHG